MYGSFLRGSRCVSFLGAVRNYYNNRNVLSIGSFLWLCQSNKDLFCVSDQNPQFRPSTVQLPPEAEMVHYSACQDAIWGLDSLGQIFIRTLSSSCPTGMHWTKLDLSQLGMTFLFSRLSLNSLSKQSVFSFRNIFWFTDTEYYIYWIK